MAYGLSEHFFADDKRPFPILCRVSIYAFLVFVAVWLPASAGQAQTVQSLQLGSQIELDLNEQTHQVLSFDGVRVDVRVIDPSAEEYDEYVEVTIARKGGQSYRREFVTGFAKFLTVGAFNLDRDGTPSLVLQNYTGGAHCCMEIYALYLGDVWVEAELAFVDGGTVEPVDADGDGLVEFVIPDGRFFYTFDAYAYSYVPSLVVATSGGDYRDLTSNASFRSILEDEFSGAAERCVGREDEGGLNSACATLMAVAARMGLFEGTFALIENVYATRAPQEQDWEGFTIYDGDTEHQFDTLPEAAAFAVNVWGMLD